MINIFTINSNAFSDRYQFLDKKCLRYKSIAGADWTVGLTSPHDFEKYTKGGYERFKNVQP